VERAPSVPVVRPGVESEEERLRTRQQHSVYRRLFMDIEREQVKENIRQRNHRLRMAAYVDMMPYCSWQLCCSDSAVWPVLLYCIVLYCHFTVSISTQVQVSENTVKPFFCCFESKVQPSFNDHFTGLAGKSVSKITYFVSNGMLNLNSVSPRESR